MGDRETSELRPRYDVVVVGGGAAGLSGALMLARSRRSVVVVDEGAPRNAPAEAVHGLLGHDGIRPGELIERGRAEVRRYGGQVLSARVVDLAAAEPAGRAGADVTGFAVRLADGRESRARRLLVTSGLVDALPDIPGLRERWGRDVLHCPYCHGWEVRDQAVGVLAGGPMSVHQALLFSQLTDDVVYFLHESPDPDPDQRSLLDARGVRLVPGRVTGLEIDDDRLSGIRIGEGPSVPRQALVIGTRMVARADFLETLGLRPVEHPSGVGAHLPADAQGRTAVDGVWVAGNVTDMSAQVGASAAAGAMAGAQINADLVMADARRAIGVPAS